MNRVVLSSFAMALVAAPAFAQTVAPGPGRPVVAPGVAGGATVVRERGNTGGDGDVIVAPGATGAETYQSDSAAGGNAAQPERAVPQGSGGGSR